MSRSNNDTTSATVNTCESLPAMKEYFDSKFRSLKRELSRDAEEREKKREVRVGGGIQV